MKALKADLNAKRTILIQEIVTDHSCITLGAGCFGAGTKLWTELGYRNIEDIQPGERVYSRDQWDAGSEIAAKIVEEVFTRYTVVLHLHVGGQVIRTTGEHPFFVVGKGWTPANKLRPGDKLACADRTTVAVEEVFDTGERELVYNLRVADYHTYFVGDEDWGWQVWAHNTYTQRYYLAADTADENKWTLYDSQDGTKVKATPTSPDQLIQTGAFFSKPKTGGQDAGLKKALNALNGYLSNFGIACVEEIYNWRPQAKSKPRQVVEVNELEDEVTKKIKTTDARGKSGSAADADYATFQNGKTGHFFRSLYWEPPLVGKMLTFKRLTGASSWSSMHAHHIVPKDAGGTRAKSAWWDAQRALRTVGIDPYFGIGNLAWTPNWPKHGRSAQYRFSVWKDIQDAFQGSFLIESNPTPQTVADRKLLGEDVTMKATLVSIAQGFFYGQYLM